MSIVRLVTFAQLSMTTVSNSGHISSIAERLLSVSDGQNFIENERIILQLLKILVNASSKPTEPVTDIPVILILANKGHARKGKMLNSVRSSHPSKSMSSRVLAAKFTSDSMAAVVSLVDLQQNETSDGSFSFYS